MPTSTSSGSEARGLDPRPTSSPRRPTADGDGQQARPDRRGHRRSPRPCSASCSTAATPASPIPPSTAGGGSPRPHERAFREEAADYVTPDLGVGRRCHVRADRPLAAGPLPRRSSSQRHIPKILSGRGDVVPVLLRARGRLGPRRHPHPGRRATATAGSSTGRRSGARGAYHADWAMCLARTDWDVPKHRGLTWFAVPTDAEGVTVRQIRQINGNAEFCEEFLDDVDRHRRRPHRRGQPRAGPSPRRCSSTSAAPASPAPPCASRARWRPTSSRWPAAPAASTTRWPARPSPGPTSTTTPSTTSAAGSPPACGHRPTPDPAVAAYSKLAAGMLTPDRGPAGPGDRRQRARCAWAAGTTTRPDRPSIDYLNGRQIAIAAGTNEMQRNGIGERVLGLPREPSFDYDQAVQRGAAQRTRLERQGRLTATRRPRMSERDARPLSAAPCPTGRAVSPEHPATPISRIWTCRARSTCHDHPGQICCRTRQ